MPRAAQSQAGRILRYFESVDLLEARLMLDLITEKVRGRLTRSTEARQRAAASAKPKAVVANHGGHAPKKAAKAAGKAKAGKPHAKRAGATAKRSEGPREEHVGLP